MTTLDKPLITVGLAVIGAAFTIAGVIGANKPRGTQTIEVWCVIETDDEAPQHNHKVGQGELVNGKIIIKAGSCNQRPINPTPTLLGRTLESK